MNSELKKEVLASFPTCRLLFDSDDQHLEDLFTPKLDSEGNRVLLPNHVPDLVLFDEKSLYCIIEYKNLSKNQIQKDFEDLKIVYNNWKHLDLNIFFEDCKNQHNEQTATSLLNLFFDIYVKFNRFHTSRQNSLKKSVLFYCAILCQEKHYREVREAVRLAYAVAKLQTSFEKVKITALKDHKILSADIANFYCAFDAARFAIRKDLV